MFIKRSLLSGCLLFFCGQLLAQTSPIGANFSFGTKDFSYKKFKSSDQELQDSLDGVRQRWGELQALLKGSGKMVTPQNYSSLVRTNFRLLSGNEIKNGKSINSSAAVDEKSVTLNFSWKPSKEREFYFLPVVSAEAEDSFVNLFSDGECARTVSYGSNFAMLIFGNSSGFSEENMFKHHNELRLDRSKYVDVTRAAEKKYFTDRVADLLKSFDSNNGPVIGNYIDGSIDDADRKVIEPYKVAVDTLVATGILPRYFSELNAADQKAIVGAIAFPARVDAVVLRRFLDKNDAKQQGAEFNSHTLRWLSGGVKVNHVGHDILAPETEDMTVKSVDTYLSGKLAGTIMRISEKGHRFYLSLSANYANPSYYPKKGLLKAQVLGAPILVGSVPVQPVTKTIEYYPQKSTVRKDQFYFDLPLAYYNSKQSLGFEIGFKGGWNDLENDNLSVRMGPLIVLNPGAESQFIFQPIFKFNKLNQKDKELWKDQFVFGANLSVSLPKGLFKK